MATKKEILEALKDPDLLKEAGLEKITNKEEEELFADIVVGDNEDISDVVRKMNERNKKQQKYMNDREKRLLKLAAEKAAEPEKDRKDKEVDSFLKSHPELSNNKKLLDIVSPLYNNGTPLEDAWKQGCKVLDLDNSTGLAPSDDKKEDEKKEDKKEAKEKKTSAMKTDSNADAGLPPTGDKKDADGNDKPKSLREIVSEQANELAAKGENPWRDTP